MENMEDNNNKQGIVIENVNIQLVILFQQD